MLNQMSALEYHVLIVHLLLLTIRMKTSLGHLPFMDTGILCKYLKHLKILSQIPDGSLTTSLVGRTTTLRIQLLRQKSKDWNIRNDASKC